MYKLRGAKRNEFGSGAMVSVTKSIAFCNDCRTLRCSLGKRLHCAT